MNTDTLQTMLNKRAENKLKQDLHNLYRTLADIRLLSAAPPELSTPKITVTDKKGGVRDTTIPNSLHMYGNTDSPTVDGWYAQKLYDLWLPYYIQEETKLFLEQVASLTEQVADLTDGVNNLTNQ